MVIRSAEAWLPTVYGEFRIIVYRSDTDNLEQVALVKGQIESKEVLVRLHSECLTGDVFSSLKCDCGAQLEAGLQALSDHGSGILLYLRQEGRGIGLGNKIKAYALQETGLDTVEANLALGFSADLRNYQAAAEMLQNLGVSSIRLLTNNPDKIGQLKGWGIDIAEQLPLEILAQPYNKDYLMTKKNKLGHLLHQDL